MKEARKRASKATVSNDAYFLPAKRVFDWADNKPVRALWLAWYTSKAFEALDAKLCERGEVYLSGGAHTKLDAAVEERHSILMPDNTSDRVEAEIGKADFLRKKRGSTVKTTDANLGEHQNAVNGIMDFWEEYFAHERNSDALDRKVQDAMRTSRTTQADQRKASKARMMEVRIQSVKAIQEGNETRKDKRAVAVAKNDDLEKVRALAVATAHSLKSDADIVAALEPVLDTFKRKVMTLYMVRELDPTGQLTLMKDDAQTTLPVMDMSLDKVRSSCNATGFTLDKKIDILRQAIVHSQWRMWLQEAEAARGQAQLQLEQQNSEWTGWTEITADNDDLTAWLADNADALQKLRQARSRRHVPALRDTDEPELGPGHFVEQARYVRQAVAVFGPALFGEMPEWLPNTVHLDLDMEPSVRSVASSKKDWAGNSFDV